ncbi:MAG: nucleotidyltransferase family protein [Eubacteriales bacterium]|nr:nucleotidyltransferase family protein [Eubacteriales bacterium]
MKNLASSLENKNADKKSSRPRKALALIAEYNPFHNGHLAQLAELKQRFGDTHLIIVILSSYFCQRGIPAVLAPRERAEIAVYYGADLVIKLPSIFSTSTAERFAAAAVELISALPQIDSLAFGLEDPESLDALILAATVEHAAELGIEASFAAAAELMGAEKSELIAAYETPAKAYPQKLKSYLKSAKSYPEARVLALHELLKDFNLAEKLKEPNQILATEYIAKILSLKVNGGTAVRSSIQRLVASTRVGHSEHSSLASRGELLSSVEQARSSVEPEAETVWSAQAIRELLALARSSELAQVKALEGLLYQLPEKSLAALLANPNWPLIDDLGEQYLWLLTRSSKQSLKEIRDWQGGLAERALNLLKSPDLNNNARETAVLLAALTERAFPLTRVQRALLSLYLNIQEAEFDTLAKSPAFLELLAFNKQGKDYLRRSRKQFGLPLVSRFSELNRHSNPALDYQAAIERRAACLYFKDHEKGHADLLEHALYLSPSQLKA